MAIYTFNRTAEAAYSNPRGFKPKGWMVVTALAVISLASTAYSYNQGMITWFYDGLSRLLIARQTLDGIHSDFPQLGTWWPPLPQVLMLPFVNIDFLYRSGLAGSIGSMVSYVVAATLLYRLILEVTKSWQQAVIGVAAFALLPAVLFMESAPMSEIMLSALAVMGIYFLYRWVSDVKRWIWLIPTAASVFLATLVRYEGWILYFGIAAVLVFTCWRNKFSFKKGDGMFVFYSFPALFGAFLWLVYNTVYYGSPFYFSNNEFSGKNFGRDAMAVLNPQERTIGNLPFSLLVYGRTVWDCVGPALMVLAAAGLVLLLLSKRTAPQKAAILLLLWPLVVYPLGMVQGGWIVMAHPELMSGQVFNLRFAVMALPGIAFLVGFVAQKRWWIQLTVGVAVVFSLIYLGTNTVPPVQEAQANQANGDTTRQEAVAAWLNGHYDGGLMLRQRTDNELIAFYSQIPFKQVIYEGDQELWKNGLIDPSKEGVRWILMSSKTVTGYPDQVWVSLSNKPALVANYSLVYKYQGIEIYKHN